MAQSQITLNEGKDYWNQHVMSGATVYAGLLAGQSVGGGTITATTIMSGITEATGTGYARKPLTLGATTAGIMALASTTWLTAAATNWPANCSGWFIASALTAGVCIYVWDFAAVHDMSKANAELFIAANNIFLMNPGEG